LEEKRSLFWFFTFTKKESKEKEGALCNQEELKLPNGQKLKKEEPKRQREERGQRKTLSFLRSIE
jgi:hypothetical protein